MSLARIFPVEGMGFEEKFDVGYVPALLIVQEVIS
jgi:hypothetical protein